MEIWEPKTPGTLWATPGLLRDFFVFYPNQYEAGWAPRTGLDVSEKNRNKIP